MGEIDPTLNWVSILLVFSIAYYVLFSWVSAVPREAPQKTDDDQPRV